MGKHDLEQFYFEPHYFTYDPTTDEVVPCSLIEWSFWFRDFANRKVEFTRQGDVDISTVCIGIPSDHDADGRPLIFETRVLGGEHDQYMERYATPEEARAGHVKLCQEMLEQQTAF